LKRNETSAGRGKFVTLLGEPYVAVLFNYSPFFSPLFKPDVQVQDTSLRMPNKWHMCKEGQAGNKKDNAAACLCFLNYLAFLRPAADRAVSILPWVVSPGRSYGFLWAVRLFKKCEVGLSNSGLFASKRPKANSRRLLKSIGREECKHRCLKLADPTYRRTT
jgi:hypothetical protein